MYYLTDTSNQLCLCLLSRLIKFCDFLANCGGDIFLRPGETFDIQSPDYDPPTSMYSDFQECTWLFRVS